MSDWLDERVLQLFPLATFSICLLHDENITQQFNAMNISALYRMFVFPTFCCKVFILTKSDCSNRDKPVLNQCLCKYSL